MAEDFQEKTEDASQKKLADGRKKGQVAKSQDFTTGFLIMIAMMTLFFFLPLCSLKSGKCSLAC